MLIRIRIKHNYARGKIVYIFLCIRRLGFNDNYWINICIMVRQMSIFIISDDTFPQITLYHKVLHNMYSWEMLYTSEKLSDLFNDPKHPFESKNIDSWTLISNATTVFPDQSKYLLKCWSVKVCSLPNHWSIPWSIIRDTPDFLPSLRFHKHEYIDRFGKYECTC